LAAELEQLSKRAQVAAGFITYLSDAPEDVRKTLMREWCESVGLQGFDFRRFISSESEQLIWKSEGLPSDDLSMENAMVILKVGQTIYRQGFIQALLLTPVLEKKIRFCDARV
jgi:dynein heavy chain 2